MLFQCFRGKILSVSPIFVLLDYIVIDNYENEDEIAIYLMISVFGGLGFC